VRSAEAHERALQAGKRARELAESARDRRRGPNAGTVARQVEQARAAFEHSADSHDRAGLAHEDAAKLADDRGESATAASHRHEATRSRAAAARDRGQR
jgi:hypothetical protein